MPLDSSSLRAIAAVGLVTLAFGGAATLVLRPEGSGRGAQPELVRTPPRPVPAEAVRPAAELGEAFIAISEAVTPAVVRIEAEHREGGRQTSLGRRLQDLLGGAADDSAEEALPEIAGGSGFIVSADGYILTNHHVINGASRISVALADKRIFTAQVVGSDPLTDVAVIRIPTTGLPAVPLGDSDSTRVGQWVLAIGNPGFDANTLDFTVTGGIISAKGRGLQVLAVDEPTQEGQETLIIEDFMQTDAVINPGNSGGPLVNLQGAVIGINTAIASTTGSYQGYGFAIPSNLVRRVMRDLVQYGFMRRPLLGVSIRDVSPEDAEVYGLPRIAGVLVEDFSEGAVAEHAGMKRHDVITEVDGRSVDRVGQLQQLIAQHDPGDEVLLNVYRYGKQLQYRVRLQEATRRAIPSAAPAAAAAAAGIGIEVADLDAATAQQHGFMRPGGAVISRVLTGSVANQNRIEAGLRIVAIDQRAVTDAREARRLLRAARPGHVLSLLLEDPAGTTYIFNLRVP